MKGWGTLWFRGGQDQIKKAWATRQYPVFLDDSGIRGNTYLLGGLYSQN